jgi:FKBP12-rapamycin complex-associated protein
LDRLIDFDGDDTAQKITRYASYLRTVMRSNDNAAMILAARSLGKLILEAGTLQAELVDSELKAALEWLQSDRQENRRFAAVLILRELAVNAPTALSRSVAQILELLWVALRDPKVLIRESAAEVLNACLKIISTRNADARKQSLTRTYDETLHSFRINTVETIHGGLHGLEAMLDEGGMFMVDHYREACDTVLRYKDHHNPMLRKEVVLLIPVLARYTPFDFAHLYLSKFMQHLQGQLKKEKDRNAALIAIGQVALSVNSAIAPYLDSIIVYVREGLGTKAYVARYKTHVLPKLTIFSRNKLANEAPVFECISQLSRAVGQAMSKYMELLLDPIFKCGLSPSLTQALVDMAHYIPPIKPMIQEKLLDLLSTVLCGRPFTPLGAPLVGLPAPPTVTKDYKDSSSQVQREHEIALALHTLGSFDFSGLFSSRSSTRLHADDINPGHVLNEFVRDVAIKYVEDDNPDIRKAAALTCCQLLVRDPIVHQTSNHAILVVSEIMEKLLTVSVADSGKSLFPIRILSDDYRSRD